VFNVPVKPKTIPALVAAAAALGLGLPAAAEARIIEVGVHEPTAVPSCPQDCNAVSRTTGYQAKVGPDRGLMKIPAAGRIVAWTITLAKPGPTQIKFFEENLGGEASAALAVLRQRKNLWARVKRLSPVVELERWFGKTVQIPLKTSIPVKKGWTIGLHVPTWAPALAVGLPTDTSWRASRTTEQCRDTQTQTAQRLKQRTQYRCLYRTARLTYSATLITKAGT
jgi:hypothetical protein